MVILANVFNVLAQKFVIIVYIFILAMFAITNVLLTDVYGVFYEYYDRPYIFYQEHFNHFKLHLKYKLSSPLYPHHKEGIVFWIYGTAKGKEFLRNQCK